MTNEKDWYDHLREYTDKENYRRGHHSIQMTILNRIDVKQTSQTNQRPTPHRKEHQKSKNNRLKSVMDVEPKGRKSSTGSFGESLKGPQKNNKD